MRALKGPISDPNIKIILAGSSWVGVWACTVNSVPTVSLVSPIMQLTNMWFKMSRREYTSARLARPVAVVICRRCESNEISDYADGDVKECSASLRRSGTSKSCSALSFHASHSKARLNSKISNAWRTPILSVLSWGWVPFSIALWIGEKFFEQDQIKHTMTPSSPYVDKLHFTLSIISSLLLGSEARGNHRLSRSQRNGIGLE